MLSGATGVSGPVYASYLLALEPLPRQFPFRISAIYAVLTGLRLVGFAIAGAVTLPLLRVGAAILPASIVGQWLGFRLEDRQANRTLETLTTAVLLLAALPLLLLSLAG